MKADTRKWFVLAGMGASLGLIVLDETVVGVALPTIRADLNLTMASSHWVVNAYLLVFTCLVAVGGKLGDMMGMGQIMLVGLGFFAAGSVSAGFAPDGTWIVIARAVQGIGAAIIFPTSIAIVTRTFPPEQRGLALGIHTSIGGVFMSAGPLLGGFLTQEISWRWIFWVNLPVIAAIALIVLTAWRKPAPAKTPMTGAGKPTLDIRGLALLVIALAALVGALMQGGDWGWASPETLSAAALGIAALVLFIRWERQVTAPLMDLGLFRNATFSGGNLVIFSQQFSKIAVIIFLAQYLQEKAGMSPVAAGALILAGNVPALLSSTVGGWATDRFGARFMACLGVAMNGAAVVVIGVMVAGGSTDWIVAPLIVWGASLPLLIVPARRAQLNAIESEKHGQASGISVSAQMLGGTIGMAVCAAILTLTGSYDAVFLALAIWLGLVLLIAARTIERTADG